MSGDSARSIYAMGAPVYRNAGWCGVLPLRSREKRPLLAGFTGYDGAWPTDGQIAHWRSKWPANNLGLRVDYGVLVLDVDDYDGKSGGATLAEAEHRWGPLPDTYRSSSRYDDPVSGQRLYRVPVGMLFRSEIKFADLGIGHIDTIQPHLRLMAAWPSIHPKTGQVYRWYAPDGSLLPEGEVPRVEDLPELPPSWVEALAKDALRDEVFDGSAPNRNRALREQINEELYQKMVGLQDQAAPDRLVADRLETALTDLMSGTSSRYDCTRDHVAGLMRMQAVGRVGVPRALRELYPAYVLEVADTRPREVAEAEFLRFTQGAAVLIAATMPGQPPDADGQPIDSGTESMPDPPSWAPIDLTGVIAGDSSCHSATLFERTDGSACSTPA